MELMTIDCDECTLQGSDACGGCLMSALCGPPPASSTIIDAAEAHAMRLLGGCGLVPPLRHRPRPLGAW